MSRVKGTENMDDKCERTARAHLQVGGSRSVTGCEHRVNQLKEKLSGKPEVADLVDEIAADPEILGLLLEIIRIDTGTLKFYCCKVIRTLSEKHPSLVYPYFDDVAALIDNQNSFIKWEAIAILSNLVDVDSKGKFETIRHRYFSLIDSDSMVTAGNAAKNACKLAMKNPEYESELTQRLLSISERTYLHKGKPSQECKNIMFGHAIGCFHMYFEVSPRKKEIIEFVAGQRHNPRKQVAKKAEAFLKKHVR